VVGRIGQRQGNIWNTITNLHKAFLHFINTNNGSLKMAKGKKSQASKSRDWTPKSQGSVKGNYPVPKTWAIVHTKKDGFQRLDMDRDLKIGKKNFPPALTGDRLKDQENLRQYRAAVRREMAKVNKQQPPKPRTIFDLLVLNGANWKHPNAATKAILEFIKNSGMYCIALSVREAKLNLS
jgi:hypothetical protein